MHVLADNRTRKRGMLAEHGLSLMIEHEDGCILFDTGQSDVYVKNAKQMGLTLSRVSRIVLSHGHYDHCGGLPFFPAVHPFPKVFVHEAAFSKKLAANKDGTFREIGIPWSQAFLERVKDSIVKTSEAKSLFPGAAVCPNIVGGVKPGREFFIDNGESLVPDVMTDEQMIVIERFNELCVFLGCSHPGIIACLRHAQKCFPGKRIGVLVAGMHLDGAEEYVIQDTIQKLKELDIQTVIPLHCTGIDAICQIKRAWGLNCHTLSAGDSISI